MRTEFKKRLKCRLSQYQKDERGTFTVFIAFTFLTMVVAAGFAWDVIRYESMRTHVQLTIDNASLAAAALDQAIDPATGQKLDPVVVANRYIDAVDIPYDVTFTPVAQINTATERKVEITAVADLNTYFLTVAGQKSMRATVKSSAYEKNALVEISLVLDISGSMFGDTKLGSLKTGAQNFVSTMLAANTSADSHVVSINLVPYSAYVNVGKDLFPQLGVTAHHSDLPNTPDGYCVRFSDSAFQTTQFPTPSQMEYVPVFGYTNYYNLDNVSGQVSTSPYCTTQEWAQISVMSNDTDELKRKIGDFEATTQTSIDDAVKWGSALLDPSARSVVQAMSSSGTTSVSGGFSSRPAAYSSETNKIMVVMTDGVNTTQYGMNSSYNSADDAKPNAWYNRSTEKLSYATPGGDDASDWEQLTWPQLWSVEPVANYVANSYSSDAWYTYMDYSNSGYNKDTRLSNICTMAKNAGVKIYTIAYEASSTSAQTMLDCSSGENYAYTASSANIDEIFANIGSGIKKLQLVD